MKKEIRFDEGFDNILIYDFDREYQQGALISADSLVAAGGRKTTSLDGEWNFCPDVFQSTIRSRWHDEVRFNRDRQPIPYDFDFEEWETVPVPGVWNNRRKEYGLYEGTGVYFKPFQWTEKKAGRVILRVGAANYETRVWLNQQYLGRHLGGFTPFCMDVTDYLKADNRLLLCVDNTRRGEQIPSLHYDWFNYGGIHRSVELLEIPDVYIRDVYLQLSKETANQLDYSLSVVSHRSHPAGCRLLEAEISIDELGIKEVVILNPVETASGCFRCEGIIGIEEEHLRHWNVEDPHLYAVTVKCMEDVFIDQIGFRRIEVKGRNILLNGEAVFLKGMCVHEESPENLRAVTEEDIINTLNTAKELGCNFLRLTHYPHSERTARLADRIGIMLWEEIPVYWALEFDNPQTLKDAKNQLTELILRDRNRASVIIWSVGNENPDTDARYAFMHKLVKVARQTDRSRLLSASCLIDVKQCKIKDRLTAELDVVGINEYYGWYIRDFGILERILDNYRGGKPIIITETGADAVCGRFGDEEEIYTEDCQAAIYQKQFDILLRYSFIRGTTPWILYDYASMRRMSALQKGYNLKGLISADRISKKKAYEVVKAIYKERI